MTASPPRALSMGGEVRWPFPSSPDRSVVVVPLRFASAVEVRRAAGPAGPKRVEVRRVWGPAGSKKARSGRLESPPDRRSLRLGGVRFRRDSRGPTRK